MLLSVLLLLLVSGTQASHYRGTLMTYYPQETYANGSVSVILRFKFNFKSCLVGSVSCSGNCGVEISILKKIIYEEVNGTGCQTETITSWLLPNNSQLQLIYAGGNWIDNLNGIGSWRAVTDVELRLRSDTNRPNSSPQTTIIPALRVPSNCQRNINLLAFDPDGDEVKCRYANISLTECVLPCTPPPVLSLSSSCTLSFSGNSSNKTGSYAVQMVMEDFPRRAITLTQTDGSQVSKTTSDAVSKIPIQFAFQVDPAAPSCSEGVYLPRFLVPTPEHRAQFYTPVSEALKIYITAAATKSEITGPLYSGPYNVVKSSLGSGSFSLTWTPSASEDGQSHPICFVVQASFNSSVYQSELRCVVVTVRNTLVFTEPVPSVNVLKMKISTRPSLKDNHDIIENLMKQELMRRGFPPGITVRLLSGGSVVVTGPPPPGVYH